MGEGGGSDQALGLLRWKSTWAAIETHKSIRQEKAEVAIEMNWSPRQGGTEEAVARSA